MSLFLNNKFPLYRGYKEQQINGKSTKPNPKGNRKTKDNKKRKTS